MAIPTTEKPSRSRPNNPNKDVSGPLSVKLLDSDIYSDHIGKNLIFFKTSCGRDPACAGKKIKTTSKLDG